MYTVQHSEWQDDLYGYQVLKDGNVIDTYEHKDMAEAYCQYMNSN